MIPPLNHLHHLVADHPLVAARHLAGYAAKGHWSRATVARALADRSSYLDYLRAQADALAAMGWDLPVMVPPWATPLAREMTAQLLSDAAAHTPPLADTRGQHQWLYRARQASRVAVAYRQCGIEVEMPFCDDAVMEACLRVRPYEAATPWSCKALLAAAMEGIVPTLITQRTTKGAGTLEWNAGMKAH
ncbi:asparagine synthase-related protein [Streptomyces swartbergensis]|uniref:asparagine synthase-related protein n=1 Tax=Streptomyces swartbergensis TaxID=487165 RepID=UPI0038282447